MTTRKSASKGKSAKAAAAKMAASERLTRPKPARSGPDRTGAGAKKEAAERRKAGMPPPPPGRVGPAAAIDEAVAEAVKSGYDVLAQTIAQGREAAEHFRQGEYNIRDVPHDLQKLTLHLLGLARQLSGTVLDLCEQLVQQVPVSGSPPPPGVVAATNPPFRDYHHKDAGPIPPIEGGQMQNAPRMAAPGPAAAAAPVGGMPISALFTGTKKAKLLTTSLARPDRPTALWEISASPLHPNGGGAAALADVKFHTGETVDGLVASIAVPKGQPPGIYSGLVFAQGQPVPLGALVVELEG